MDVSRVEDFLNDKIQTFADFDTLDTLLASVQSQQALLKQQLEDADHNLRRAESESTACAQCAKDAADAFSKQQADIDRRLLILTQSDSVDDALTAFKPHMAKLSQLDAADKYIGLLEEVEQLHSRAIEHANTAPEIALAAYHQLYALGARLESLQQAADGAAPHLVDHVGHARLSVRQQLRNAFAAELQKVLDQILWPRKSEAIPIQLQSDFRMACERLLTLQKPELEATIGNNHTPSAYQRLPVLLPLEVMIEPLAARFKYHFSGDKPTNRLDKPEFFLDNFLDVLTTHAPFVTEHIQPILFSSFRDSTLVDTGSLLDAQEAFITAMLPMVESKLSSLLPQVSGQPQLLSHLVHAITQFDIKVREEWRYDGSLGNGRATWGGLCWEMLTSNGWFDRWINVEQEFALARYQTIMDDANAMLLDYDSVGASITKPTAAAIRVHDLITTITLTYRPLTSLSQKLRFLMDVQVAMLDRFHDRLRSALQAFESKTSTVTRTVQGVSATELAELQGVSGLDRLCRIFGSADYLERAMRDWSDDVFFLDMWNQLQTRVRQNKENRPVAGSLGLADIAAKTSSALASSDETEDVASGALFDETASSYATLRERAEALIITTAKRGITEGFRSYSRNSGFATSAESAMQDVTPTNTLAPTLSSLQESLEFLSSAVSPHVLRRMARRIAHIIDDLLFDLVISKDFSQQGAKQLACDEAALSGVLLRFAPRSVGIPILQKAGEAAKLLNLSSDNAALPDQDTVFPSLRDVENRLFVSNDEARAVLRELGLHLNEGEARKVIKCRIEVSE